MRITVLSDVYEPGSTFKMLTASAAIDSGVTNPQEGFYCSGKITVTGQHRALLGRAARRADHGTGAVQLVQPGVYSAGIAAGQRQAVSVSQGVWPGVPTGIDLYGEASGILISQSRVKNVDLARIGFGQSIAVTPIQMITAACAVVNGGRLMKPYLVEAIEDEDGNVLEAISPKVVSHPISESTSATMRELLLNVVEEGGGKNAKVSGWFVGGKTGTAQIYKDGKISPNLHIGSFVGFAPAQEPKVAVLVTVNEAQVVPDYGGTTGGALCSADLFGDPAPAGDSEDGWKRRARTGDHAGCDRHGCGRRQGHPAGDGH